MTDVLDQVRRELGQLVEDWRGILTPEDKVVIAQRLDDYAQLVARQWAGEHVEDAIASRLRSLESYRMAAGAALSSMAAVTVTRVLTGVFGAILSAAQGGGR